jgi:hypothetical protein
MKFVRNLTILALILASLAVCSETMKETQPIYETPTIVRHDNVK